jgi:hypothetical protein
MAEAIDAIITQPASKTYRVTAVAYYAGCGSLRS